MPWLLSKEDIQLAKRLDHIRIPANIDCNPQYLSVTQVDLNHMIGSRYLYMCGMCNY